MGFLGNFFVSIDQLGNVIAGGNPDNTISARVGYYNRHKNAGGVVPWQWRVFEEIIDFTFYPIDGDAHCHEAFHNDAGEFFNEKPNDIIIAILSIFIIISCIPIALLLYTLWLFRIVSPKDIDRNKDINERLLLAKAKLNGTLHELNEHKVDVDDILRTSARETVEKAQEVQQKINAMLDLLGRAGLNPD